MMIDELKELSIPLTHNMRPILVALELPATVQVGYHHAQKERVAQGQDIQTLNDYLAGIILQHQIDMHWTERMSKR